jgi:hypothetical protein
VGQAAEDLRSALCDADFRVGFETVCAFDVLVARRSEFRWEWVGIRVHTFVFMVAGSAGDIKALEELTSAAEDHAIQRKGGLPRGLQTGTLTMPVFLTERASSDVRGWFGVDPHHRFGAMRWPVLVEVATGVLTDYRGATSKGWVYKDHLRTLGGWLDRPRRGRHPAPRNPRQPVR